MTKLDTYAVNTWCPGCGNFGILSAVKRAFRELEEDGLPLERIVILSGIGCHGKIVDYINVNSLYSIHGRVIPAAVGIKLANPNLIPVGFAGDGDAYGEGLEHLIFAAKRNVNITLVVHNNMVYALTAGQFTPTSPLGFSGKSTPTGSPEEPLNPIAIALASGGTFIARAFAGNVKQVSQLMKQAILHKGFSLIDILQPCVTFFNTFPYLRENVYDLQEEGHNVSDYHAAMEKALEWNHRTEGRVPTGIFYRIEKPTYDDVVLRGRIPVKLRSIKRITHVLSKHV